MPNSNLFTRRMLFYSREATSEIYGPGAYSLSYLLRDLFFICFCLQIYYSKNPKIPCCTFSLFILFSVFARSLYSISYNLIYLNTKEGLTTPLTRWVASICSLCVGTVCIVFLGSPTGLIPWFHNYGKCLP